MLESAGECMRRLGCVMKSASVTQDKGPVNSRVRWDGNFQLLSLEVKRRQADCLLASLVP